jgi:hypothetical protein
MERDLEADEEFLDNFYDDPGLSSIVAEYGRPLSAETLRHTEPSEIVTGGGKWLYRFELHLLGRIARRGYAAGFAAASAKSPNPRKKLLGPLVAGLLDPRPPRDPKRTKKKP